MDLLGELLGELLGDLLGELLGDQPAVLLGRKITGESSIIKT